MDAAYALMVRVYEGVPGKNLLEAIELTNQSFEISDSSEAKEAATAAKNATAVNELNSMMAGVQRRR